MKNKEKKNLVSKIAEKLKDLKEAPQDSSGKSVSAETLSNLDFLLGKYATEESRLISLRADYESAKKSEAKVLADLKAAYKSLKKHSKNTKRAKDNQKTKEKKKTKKEAPK